MRLNLETRAQHPDADAAWVELMSYEATREQYIETLVTTYGFEAPVEAAVALTPGVSTLLPLRQRARSGYLVQDLLALGLSPSRIARLPTCCDVVPFRDAADAMGWMYVVERSTLLHDTVRRHLDSFLPERHALTYLGAYEGVAGIRWQELGQALDEVATTRTIGNQIVEAAREAFATRHNWFASARREAEGGHGGHGVRL